MANPSAQRIRRTVVTLLFLSTGCLAQSKFQGQTLLKCLEEQKYATCLSKVDKLIANFPREPLPYLAKGISLYKLQEDAKVKTRYPNLEDVIFKSFQSAKKNDLKSLKLDTGFNDILTAYQKDLFAKGEALRAANKRKSDLYFGYAHQLFDNKHPSFTSLYPASLDYQNNEYNFAAWDNPRFRFCNTARDAAYMSKPEKEMVYLLNLVRVEPQLFLNTYVKRYKELHPRAAESSYFRSLEADLAVRKKAESLAPNEGLYKGATFHAADMGEHGQTGHNSSDGTDTWTRIFREGNVHGRGENCSYGVSDPLGIIFQLLIDEGIESLGHRLNMLNPSFSEVGISQRPHKGYGTNTVMDFR